MAAPHRAPSAWTATTPSSRRWRSRRIEDRHDGPHVGAQRRVFDVADGAVRTGLVRHDEALTAAETRAEGERAAAEAVVTGRFGELPTLRLTETELPLQRFLERKRVFYPGVELVVDAELSVNSDPYLNDHVVQKERLLPAVVVL